MSSRWMLQVAMRNRAHRRRLGNESLTDREIKHGKRFIIPLDNGGVLIEPWEKFLDRIYAEAAVERINPTEWWRRLARVIQILPGPLTETEWKMIKRSAQTGIWRRGKIETQAEPVEALIERIRKHRITHPQKQKETHEQRMIRLRARGRQKPRFELDGLRFPTFVEKE
jgi:hypothetical protein